MAALRHHTSSNWSASLLDTSTHCLLHFSFSYTKPADCSPTTCTCVCAACLEVMATLLVVGSMDDARADIQGNGAVQLNFAEKTTQVR